MSINLRSLAGIAFGLLVTTNVRSELVTFRYEGKVTHVQIDIPDFWGAPEIDWPEVGASFSGYYTFDSSAADTSAAPEQGAYHAVLENATAVDVRVGELNLEGAATFVATYSSIYEAGDWIPSIELVSHPAEADLFNHNNFQLSIRKDGLLPGPILPLTPPSIEGAEYAVLRLGMDSGYNTRPWPYVWIEATLDSLELVPRNSGDYNNNGIVDSADYLIWRKSDGSQEGYDMWRANFGQATQGVASASRLSSVPEPSTLFLLTIVCAIRLRVPHRKRARTNNSNEY